MSRDPRNLRVFRIADDFVIDVYRDVYRTTASFPDEERFGLRVQLRRAALSAACNIVEGSARQTSRDYVHFLHVATGSAAEAQYLIEIALRLEMLAPAVHTSLTTRYSTLLAGLQKMTRSLEGSMSLSRKPEA